MIVKKYFLENGT